MPPSPILPDESGAPQWPDGIVGSMTHCDGYRAATVAHDRNVAAIGIDAELHEPLPDGLLAAIARDAESRRHEQLCRAVPDVHWDRLLFSAKESAYKAWYPLTRRWLGFEEADITLRPDGTFITRLLTTPAESIPPTGFTGRWLTADDLLLTVTTLPPAEPRF
jgi:4'-phosphopantetheinyl transferase EntD